MCDGVHGTSDLNHKPHCAQSKASSDDARLLITDGQDEPLVGKGVYFIRVCDPSKQINTDKVSDLPSTRLE